MAAEIGDGEFAEHVVEDRRGVLDRVVAGHDASRFELGEGEGLHIFFQRHAILQAERNGDGEVVHHRTEGRTFLVHVDEDFADAAVTEFTGAQIDLVTANGRLLGVTLTAVRQLFTLTRDTLDDAFDDLFGDRHGLLCSRLLDQFFDQVFFVLVFHQRRIERLGKLGTIAVKGVGL